MRTVTVAFTTGGQQYTYNCGLLIPSPDQFLLVPVGRDNSLKVVRAIKVEDGVDPAIFTFAIKEIWGIITTQEDARQEQAAKDDAEDFNTAQEGRD